MTYSRKRPSLDPCPVETVLAIVSGKWKVRVLYLLSLDDLTFGEIGRLIGGIRQQVLSSLLRELIASGVICRTETVPPKESLYSLTEKGRELIGLLVPLAAWGNKLLSERGQRWIPPIPQHRPRRRLAAET